MKCKMNNCTHSQRYSKWITTNYYGEEIAGEWEHWTERTTVDVDLHRYKCTMCEKIMYYSGAAGQFYEKGIDSDVYGLR